MMFQFLLKNLRGKRPKNPLSRNALSYRLMSYKNESIIGGGLDKPQGGIKEETYFSKQNNNLMLKIREHGTKLKKESSVANFNPEVLDNFKGHTTLSGSCSRNKHKNCLEEAFFLNEQSDCCAKLYKDSSKRLEIQEPSKPDVE